MKRTLFSAAFAALALITAAPAFAQIADAPSPAKLALARQIVNSTGMTNSLANAMHGMMRQAFTAAANPNLPAATQAKMEVTEQAEEDMMTKLMPKIIDIAVDTYARTYSERELTDLLAFYKSPSGQSMRAKSPQMTQTMMSEILGLMPEMRHDLGEEICAKTTCNAAEKAAYGLSSAAKN